MTAAAEVAATISRRSDEQLGRRLAAGEAPAFDELYRRYVHRLSAYGAHLLGDGAAGDDVAQVALMRAYQALRAGDVPERVRPWLFRIAHNAAIDAVRTRRELPTAYVPERATDDGAGSGALLAAVAALPERQRRVFVLRELHGLRIGETAAELGLSAQQVEQSLFAARNRLAEQLVFGERLGCDAVRRLAAGPLDLRERRALKTHVRSCPACRRDLGRRGVALALLPAFGLPRPTSLAAAFGAAAVATVPLGATLPASHAIVPARPRAISGPDVPLSVLAQRHAPVVHRAVRHVRPAAPRRITPPPPPPVVVAAAPVVPVSHSVRGVAPAAPVPRRHKRVPTTTDDGSGDGTTTTTLDSSDGGAGPD